jgi:hypothetical protein
VPGLLTGTKRPPAPVTITNQAKVRVLAALIDGLALNTIPGSASCPAPVGTDLRLTFRARYGGPALAVALTGQDCGSVAFAVNGKQEPPLTDEPTLETKILSVAALRLAPSANA